MGDRIELEVLDQHPGVAAPSSFSEISVFAPDSECRIFSSAFGSTAIGVAVRLRLRRRAVEHRRHLALAARAPRFVLAERVARCRFEYGFHVLPLYRLSMLGLIA